jgi:transcriptional regulator with XRE-family HTH domain
MKMNAGEKIVILRRRVGMSQADLADKSGIAKSMIFKIEAGEVSPRVEQLESIAKALGATASVAIEPVKSSVVA